MRNWIQTYTGKRVDPLDMTVDEIDVRDIAHSLAAQDRYTGHTKWHYSVGQHSYYVSHYVPFGFELEGLLHDASEAYLSDVARPLKHRELYKEYREAEQRLEEVIAEKFGLPFPMSEIVKEWDQRIGGEEAWQLMNADESWGVWVTQYPRVDLIIPELLPRFVERLFLDRYEELTGKTVS